MGLGKSIAKTAALAGAAIICPAVAGPLLCVTLAHKVTKAATEEDEKKARRKTMSVIAGLGSAGIDVDVDSD